MNLSDIIYIIWMYIFFYQINSSDITYTNWH